MALLGMFLWTGAHAAEAIEPKPETAAKPVRLAEAPIAASCQLTEIHATTEKKGIDPKLARLKPKLTKPPFSAWDTFKLLAEPTVIAEKDKPSQAKLATGGTITLLLKDKVVSQGGKPRLRVGIDVDDKAGKRALSTVMVFGAGDVHFPIAGAPHDKGVYIAGLSCAMK